MNILDNLIYFERLLKGRALRKNIPLTISLSVTGNCNFRCSYCYGEFGSAKKEHDLPTGAWLSLIDEAAKMGAKSIQLLGGEPLLRDDIEEIIEKITSHRIICSMNSNGSLIRKRIDAVRKLDYITVSIDGFGEVNDRTRGKGTYEIIWKGISALAEEKIPYSLVCVITKNNINEVEAILKEAARLGASIEFNLLYEQHNSGKEAPFQLTSEEIKEALRLLNGYKDKDFPLSLSNRTREYALNWPVSYDQKILYNLPDGFAHIPCYMGNYMCHIEHDGSVYPCAQLIGHFPALNFLKAGFRRAWENAGEMRQCKTCYSLCHNEINLLHRLNFKVIYNSARRKLKQIAAR